MKKKFFALMMAMVMVLSLAACGGSDEADSNSGDSAGGESSGSSAFKVGVIGPLTGGAAIYGTCVANSRPDRGGRDQRPGRRHPVRADALRTTSTTPRPPSTPTTP